MFSPSSTTFPCARAPGISSWRRLRQRTRVDFPHPEGPISAVTWFGSTDNDMSSMASLLPYHAERFAISKLAAISHTPSCGYEPCDQCKSEHQRDEGQSGRPRSLDLFGIGRLGAREDLEGQGRHRLGDLERDERAAERGEQQRGRL